MALTVIMVIDTPEGVDVSVTSEPPLSQSIDQQNQTEGQKLVQKMLDALKQQPVINDGGLASLIDQSGADQPRSIVIPDGPRGVKAAKERELIAAHFKLGVLLYNVDVATADLEQLPQFGALILLDKSRGLPDDAALQLRSLGFRVASYADALRAAKAQ